MCQDAAMTDSSTAPSADGIIWNLAPLMPELDTTESFEHQFEQLENACKTHEQKLNLVRNTLEAYTVDSPRGIVHGKVVLDALKYVQTAHSFEVRTNQYLTLLETTHVGDGVVEAFCAPAHALINEMATLKNHTLLTTDYIPLTTAAALMADCDELAENYADYFDSGKAANQKLKALRAPAVTYPLSGDTAPRDIFFILQNQPEMASDPKMQAFAAEGIHKGFLEVRQKALQQLGASAKDMPLFEALAAINGIPADTIHNVLSTPVTKPRLNMDEEVFPLPSYEWDDACNLVINAFTEFNPELGLAAQEIIARGWIHASPSTHKVKSGSAFSPISAELLDNPPTYVSLNFNDDLASVRTLAHELGHATSFLLTSRAGSKMPSNTAVQETFAHLMESFVFDSLIKHANEPTEKLAIAAYAVKHSLGSVQSCQMLTDGVQHIADAIDAAPQTPLGADTINAAFRTALQSSLGEEVAASHTDEMLRSCWYHREQPFLDASYDMCYLASIAGAMQFMQEYRDASPQEQQKMGERWIGVIKTPPANWEALLESAHIELPANASPFQYHARQLRDLADGMDLLPIFKGRLDYLDELPAKPPSRTHQNRVKKERDAPATLERA